MSEANDDRVRARARALATARAITLGLAVAGASLAGCETLEARYCQHFPDTERCCTRNGGSWIAASRSCTYAMPGPFVPPV